MVAFQHQFITDKNTKRWLMIFDELSREQSRTTKELAKYINTSIRTVIQDMNEIKEYFGPCIEVSVSKKGYDLKIVDMVDFSKKKRDLFQSEPLFIIMEALFHDKKHTIDEWLSVFPISLSSLYRMLKKLEELLKTFDLTLNLTPVSIEGEEADIRKLFHIFYYETETTPHTIFPDILIQNIVMDFFHQIKGVTKNTATFWTLSYWLYISLERFQAQKIVAVEEPLTTIILADTFFPTFCQLNNRLKQDYGFKLPQSELVYLYTILISHRGLDNQLDEMNFARRYSISGEAQALAIRFCEERGLPTNSKDRDVIFLTSFFIREQLKCLISATYIKKSDEAKRFTKSAYKENYKENYDFLKAQALFPSMLIGDISVSLTLFFESIQYFYWGTPINIVFLLEGDPDICLSIRAFVYKYFGRYQNLFFPDSSDFSLDYLERNHIDLIVMNTEDYFEQFDWSVNTLLLKSIPDASDWNRFLRRINPKITNHFSLRNNPFKG